MHRKRLLYDYTRFTILLTLILIGYTFYTGFVFARYVMMVSLPIIGFIMYYSRVPKYRVPLSNFFIGLCSLIAYLLCVFSGGIQSQVLPWFAIIPLLALLLHEKQPILTWSLLSLCQIISLFFTDTLVNNSPYVFDGHKFPEFNFVLSLGLMSLITAFVLIIEQVQSKGKQELRRHIEDLKASEEELRQNMEELSSTQDILSNVNDKLNDNILEMNEVNIELRNNKLMLIQKKEKLEFYANKLYELTKNEFIQSGDLDNALKLLLQEAVHALGTTRASIWLYQNQDTELYCKLLCNINQDTYESGLLLEYNKYPLYFERIKDATPLVVNDVYSNKYTSPFKENYLIPLQINSMLDIPLFINGKSKGVICLENQLEQKIWTDEDLSFSKSLADLVAISFQSAERTTNAKLLQQQSEEILIQNKFLNQITEDLKASNDSLDRRVNERTKQLQIQNTNFAEYTFINVHLLRAPLCRVLGLSELLKYGQLNAEDRDLIEKLDYECKDLEKLIAKITQVLESGEVIDRDKM